MKSLSVALIDLCEPSPSALVQDIKAILNSSEIPVRLTFSEEKTAILSALKESSHPFHQSVPDVLLIVLPGDIGEIERSVIRKLSQKPGRIPIIAVIKDAETNQLMDLFRLGVVDFITPPVRQVDLLPRLWRLVEHAQKRESMRERLKETVGLKQLIGTSPAFTAETQKIPLIADCDSNVLISGETGTGKEMFARAIHYLSPRSDKPFIPVNCGAIPVELIENELFGHVRGAYTSAATSQDGIIQESDGGMLFLDEIDCLPLHAQVKLLRFLQEKEFRQLGSAKTRRADVRIIAATNCDLDHAVQKGAFRRDLFYRLNIIRVSLLALRERREDIPLLARHFVDHYSLEFNRPIDGIETEAMQKLLAYDWPGNVRELRNVIERAVVFSSHDVLQKDDIHLPQAEPAVPALLFQEAKARVIVHFEKTYINDLLIAHRGNITRAARAAGKNRRAFWELIRKHEIDVQVSSFRPSNQDNLPPG